MISGNKVRTLAFISMMCLSSSLSVKPLTVKATAPIEATKTEEKDITVAKDLVMTSKDTYSNIRVTATPDGKVCGKLRVGDTAKILEKDNADWYKIQSGDVVGWILKKDCLTGKDLKKYISEHTDDLNFEAVNKSYSPVGLYKSEKSMKDDNLVCVISGVAKKDTYIYLGKDSKKSQEETQLMDVYRAQSEDGLTIFYGEADEDSIRHRLIPNDTELDIIEEDEEWTKILYDDIEGYVKTIQVVHTYEDVPLSNIGDTLEKDQEVKVYDIDDKGWATVESENAIGYAKAKDLELTYTTTSDTKAKSVLGYKETIEIKEWKDNIATVIVHEEGEEDKEMKIDLADCSLSVEEKDCEKVDYKKTIKKTLDMSKLKDNETTKQRTKIVNYALKFLGNPYVWGGTSLTNGADCSGFCQSVLKHFDIKIPRVACDQAKAGKAVKPEDIRVGDLVFYANSEGYVNHVGMYIGNGEIINASSPSTGIKISKIGYRNVVAIRNVID